MKPKIFSVGGSVRDELLGKEPKDHDFVVVGADVQWMLDQGFKQVGQAFPVFLHPETGDEYALARREKKIAPGYQGFEFEFGPHITLEEDLFRRDLSINSIAKDLETGEIVDPFGGCHDLAQGIIRHTSEAFAEDPLRVLRVARFAARYNFKISEETEALCAKLVSSGELDALSADRIWIELEKLLNEDHPSIGMKFLRHIGANDTKRLDGLLSHVEIIKDSEIEASLNFIEKVLFNLNVQNLSQKKLEEFRIPIHVSREIRFLDEMYTHVEHMLIPDLVGEFIPAEFVKTVDKFREKISQKKLSEFNSLIMKTFGVVIDDNDLRVLDFIDYLQDAADEILALDFTEKVKGLKGHEIKDLVLKTKIEIIERHLK